MDLSTHCDCPISRGQYNEECKHCRRRHSKAESQRKRRLHEEDSSIKVPTDIAEATMHLWHRSNDTLKNYETWRNHAGVAIREQPGFTQGDQMFLASRDLNKMLGKVLNQLHQALGKGKTTSECALSNPCKSSDLA
jgi:hypothetical protein